MTHLIHPLARHEKEKSHFGFWIYLMSDCILFATLFVTYAVLHGNTYGGAGAHELFNVPFAFLETLVLLVSSFTMGLAMLQLHRNAVRPMLWFLALTLILGVTFVTIEAQEFTRFIAEGNGPQRSGFLSSFFTLVGTHGLHVIIGIGWMLCMMAYVGMRGLTESAKRRLVNLSMFWHFLDVVWIFIFTFVYLLSSF